MSLITIPEYLGLAAALVGVFCGIRGWLHESVGAGVMVLACTVPGVRRVALMWDPNKLGSIAGEKDVVSVAQRVGVHVISVPIRRSDDPDPALTTLTHGRPHALLIHPAPSIWDGRAMVVEFALKHRFPSITTPRAGAGAGLPMSHGPDPFDAGRRAARCVDKILKEAKPAELPIEQPTKFELLINLKTAKALGLTIPPSLLLRADQVIE
jgi:putative ABC transport system substrate-binding protein